MEKKALGRGLSALISANTAFKAPAEQPAMASKEVPDTVSSELQIAGVAYVSISEILPNPEQPRQNFSEEELKELSESIKAHGVLQPILVRKAPEGSPSKFQIIAGERRWRAAKHAGLKEVPVIEKDLTEKETLEIALVENIQRQNLTPMEEARAFEKLSAGFNLTQDELAKVTGKNRTTVANSMRLLKLPMEVQQLLEESKITTGHAKCILSVKEPKVQINLAKKVVEEGLSVRDLERVVSRSIILPNKNTTEKTKTSAKDSSISEIEEQLRRALGTKVFVKTAEEGRGTIKIECFSAEEMERVVDKICA